VTLPTYPFQRERYWMETPAPAPPKRTEKESGVHPLLGRRVGLDPKVVSK
jgi:acyl transferase domain-containing protein